MGSGEFAAIDRIRSLFPDPPPGQVWIGDDAAVLEGGLLVAADAIVAGVHFKYEADPVDVGWRAVAVNVSDIAAMGGRPTALLVTVAAPSHVDLDGLYRGIAAAAQKYSCPVVGGDLTNSETLVVSVTVLGTTDGRHAVLRAGAAPGDIVYVTGPLGGAAASGYHLRPEPRVAEGIESAIKGATSMIDVSDGLAADLGHVLDASRVGVVIDTVPVADGATDEHAWTGGEDYELLFTIRPGVKVDALPIGHIVEDRDKRPPYAHGWEHTFG
jgi:thiamine-monophosphate kinase